MPVPWSRGNDRSIECMYFDVGGNRSTRRKPTQTRREHANSTQKGRDSNPGPSCCEATALTTAPPCCPGYSFWDEKWRSVNNIGCANNGSTWMGTYITHNHKLFAELILNYTIVFYPVSTWLYGGYWLCTCILGDCSGHRENFHHDGTTRILKTGKLIRTSHGRRKLTRRCLKKNTHGIIPNGKNKHWENSVTSQLKATSPS